MLRGGLLGRSTPPCHDSEWDEEAAQRVEDAFTALLKAVRSPRQIESRSLGIHFSKEDGLFRARLARPPNKANVVNHSFSDEAIHERYAYVLATMLQVAPRGHALQHLVTTTKTTGASAKQRRLSGFKPPHLPPSSSSGNAAYASRGGGLAHLGRVKYAKAMFEAERLALQSMSSEEKRKVIGHLARIARLITAKTGYHFDYNENEFNMPSGLWPRGTPAQTVFNLAFHAGATAIFVCDYGYVILGWGRNGWWRNVVLAMAHVAIAGPQDEAATTPFALDGKRDDPHAFTRPAHIDYTPPLFAAPRA